MDAACDPPLGMLVALTHIDQCELLPRAQPREQLGGRDGSVVGIRVNAAELVVVDELGDDRRVLGGRVADLAGARPQRVVDEDAAEERFADSGDELDRLGGQQ